MNANEQAVAAVLAKYQDALNASDTNAVMPLYVDDGVFMPPYSPSAVGREALRKAYDAVFKAITLHVKFNIAEVVEVGPGWVFARTNSAGTNTDNATGQKSAEATTIRSSAIRIMRWMFHRSMMFFRKTGVHPGSSPGPAFSASCCAVILRWPRRAAAWRR